METIIFENNKDSIKEKYYRKENFLWEWELLLNDLVVKANPPSSNSVPNTF